MKSYPGHTLVEISVVMVVAAIVMGAAYSLLVNFTELKSNWLAARQVRLQKEMAISTLTQDLFKEQLAVWSPPLLIIGNEPSTTYRLNGPLVRNGVDTLFHHAQMIEVDSIEGTALIQHFSMTFDSIYQVPIQFAIEPSFADILQAHANSH